ncbi:MAG: cytochrome P450 [Chromatiales bacterium]|nr:cytochrome P450 [Chromatiales bacterium]
MDSLAGHECVEPRDLADLSSHDVFLDGVPHRTFEYLRREDPLAWFDEAGASGFWAVTRHADIVAVNRNYRQFSSRQGIRMEEMADDERAARLTMMEQDPPEHTRLRRFVNRGFARPLIETYERRVQDIVIDVLGRALARSEFDCVAEIAKPLPLKMLANVLGVSDEDGAWLARKGDQMIANSDPDFTDHVVDRVDTDAFRLMPFRSPAGAEVFEYAERQAVMRRRQPRDDVISLLLEPLPDGTPLTDLEFKNFFTLLISAGNDTTRYAIASSLHVLANQPNLLEQLRCADERLWSTAVEELLRWSSPTMHFRRTAVEDFEMHGRRIRAGDKLILWFISGDYDETVFEAPYRVDLTRDPNPHMAFGRGGPHACLGMWLARLELRVVLQELVSRIRSIRQTGPEARLRSNFINGIKSLPVAVVR